MNEPPKQITLAKLQSATQKAYQLAQQLRKDYPSLKLYLVITRSGEYASAPDSIGSIIKAAPNVFHENSAKTECLRIARNEDVREDAIKKRLAELATQLQIKADAWLEIRFDHLDYEEIGKQQKDPRVDSIRTPKTKASIRIVLGSLEEWV